MVIDDVDRSAASRPKTENSDSDSHAFIASPVDRLAAFMADLVIFLPLVTLFIAPLKRQALLAQIAGDNQKLLLLGFFGALIVGTLLVAYQTLFIGIFGTTPGKHFLGLRVVNLWSKQKPTYFSAFTRSLFWFFSLLTFGLPWLAIFSNSHRRPLHDRVADTLTVVRDRSRAAAAPGLIESSMISGLNAAVITFALLLAAIFAQSYIHQNKEIADALVSEKVASTQRCDQVTSAASEWLGTELKAPNRMEIALALHAGDRIDDDCLETEATTNFLEEKYLRLSYLAKALIKKDDPQEFADYMDKVCESGDSTTECELLENMQGDSAKPIAVDSTAATYFRLWAIKLNLERGFAAEALAQLTIPAPHMDLAYFFANKRLQAKLDLKYEADQSSEFLNALDGLNREERISLARETCLAETQLSCGQKVSCEKLLEFTTSFKAENQLSFENPNTVLAISRAVRCENNSELYEKFGDAVELTAGRTLIQAEQLLAEGKKSAAVRSLRALLKQDDLEDIQAEVAALLLEASDNSTDFEKVAAVWSDVEKDSPSWRRLAWSLESAYAKRKDFAHALEVGKQLKASGLKSIELQKSLIVAAYNSHQTDEARDLVAEYDAMGSSQSSLALRRIPASTNEDNAFNRIVEQLRSSASSSSAEESHL